MDKYFNANAIFSIFSKKYMELKKDLPIRPSEMGVLNIITKKDGLFTPLMIAELLEVSKPMITNHITVLENKGYIIREYSKEDKRSFYLIPTEKAKELVEVTEKKMSKYLQQIENSVGKENFNQLLQMLTEANKTLKNIEGEDL